MTSPDVSEHIKGDTDVITRNKSKKGDKIGKWVEKGDILLTEKGGHFSSNFALYLTK